MKIIKIVKGFHGSVDLLDVLVGRTYRRGKKILHKPSHIGTSVDNGISFQNHFIVLNVDCSGQL